MGRIGIWTGIAPLCVALVSGTGDTQPLTPKAALERLFTAERMRAEWFAPGFLAQVSVERVEQIIADLRRTGGAYQRVDEDGGQFLVVFERAVVPTRIVLDAEGRIVGLLFSAPRERLSGLDAGVQVFRALPGRVSLLIQEAGQERAALNADMPLAVGSAFKLTVLAALREQIRPGPPWSG